MENPLTENCAEKAVDGAEYPQNGVNTFEMIEKKKKGEEKKNRRCGQKVAQPLQDQLGEET